MDFIADDRIGYDDHSLSCQGCMIPGVRQHGDKGRIHSQPSTELPHPDQP